MFKFNQEVLVLEKLGKEFGAHKKNSLEKCLLIYMFNQGVILYVSETPNNVIQSYILELIYDQYKFINLFFRKKQEMNS